MKKRLNLINRKAMTIIMLLSATSLPLLAQEDPKATIGGKSEGFVTRAELLAQDKLVSSSDDLVIQSFTLSYPVGEDDFMELETKTNKLTPEMKKNIAELKPGTEIAFENIKAKKGETVIIIQSINLKVKE